MSAVRITGRLGLFGGTFDPPHVGHLIIAEAAREWAGLDRVIFIPSAAPPHKSGASKGPVASFEHRLRMTELAARGHERFESSGMEGLLPGPSYTVNLLREIRREVGGDTELCFLIGADWVERLATWKESKKLFDLCRFLIAPRPGHARKLPAGLSSAIGAERAKQLEEGWVPGPEIGISSTDLRARLEAGRSVRYLVPAAVEKYIRRHGLYGAQS